MVNAIRGIWTPLTIAPAASATLTRSPALPRDPFMRTRVRAILVLSGCLFGSASSLAESDSGSYVVIPGRPDVPVIVNPYGFDASLSIVEGDFGLNKPAMVFTTIIAAPGVV